MAAESDSAVGIRALGLLCTVYMFDSSIYGSRIPQTNLKLELGRVGVKSRIDRASGLVALSVKQQIGGS